MSAGVTPTPLTAPGRQARRRVFPSIAHAVRLVFVLLLVAGGLLLAAPTHRAAAAGNEVGPDRVYFAQTGHYLAYGFLDYWRHNGAVATFGYPLSEEVKDAGSGLTAQYFERAVFEWHGDAPAGWQVQLRRLGALEMQGNPALKAITAAADDSCDFYAQTGHTLCNGFRGYWADNGGLAIFGYPITQELQEKNPDDGKTYTVQYFERARFEYHPENPAGYTVELGRLGAAAAKQDKVSTAAIPKDANTPDYASNLWYVPKPKTPADVTTPPPGAPSDEAKWIEVDLTHQYMRAWEYSTVYYGEYISSGVAEHPTPTGTFHIFEKLEQDDMTDGPAAPPDEYYYLPNVPWVMYFLDGGYALHGTYWHHNFGTPMSHGCVNMTIDGAHTVYDWAPIGTTVWIHY